MSDAEHFHDILFELSNEDRFKILQALMTDNYNVTNMSKHLSLTTQEASRHLNRLAEADLIEKNAVGEYELTTYGRLILGQATGIMFAASNRDYFTNHKTGDLPHEFSCKITKLRESRLITDVMVSFANIDRIIDEASEYIWRLTDRYNMMSLPKLEAATEKGVMLKLMQTKDFQYPPEWPGPGIVLKNARIQGKFEVRNSPEANIFIAMNEKEVAILAFPMENNLFDYRGFSSTDPKFHSWCNEIFQYYWEKAVPVS